jgi:hypothetical protein
VRRVKGKTDGLGSRGRPDPWGKAIYGFEEDWPEANVDSLTIAQCEILVKFACDAYGMGAPKVGYDRKAKLSYCYADGSGIFFAKTQRNKFVVLHEAAHFIADKTYGQEIEDHGKEWQGVYFYLLSKAEIMPMCALKASLKDRGLPWHRTSPKDLAKWQSQPQA